MLTSFTITYATAGIDKVARGVRAPGSTSIEEIGALLDHYDCCYGVEQYVVGRTLQAWNRPHLRPAIREEIERISVALTTAPNSVRKPGERLFMVVDSIVRAALSLGRGEQLSGEEIGIWLDRFAKLSATEKTAVGSGLMEVLFKAPYVPRAAVQRSWVKDLYDALHSARASKQRVAA